MCFPALRELCSWVSNVIHVWLAQLAPCSQPMRSRTKTNPDLPAGIYPRQAPVACDYYGALLANAAIGRSIIALILFFRHSLEYCSSTDWMFSHAYQLFKLLFLPPGKPPQYYIVNKQINKHHQAKNRNPVWVLTCTADWFSACCWSHNLRSWVILSWSLLFCFLSVAISARPFTMLGLSDSYIEKKVNWKKLSGVNSLLLLFNSG